MTTLAPVTVNLLGLVEHPAIGDSPYRVDADGRPYVPAGDGGIVLGLSLGDSVFAADADHAAPGACLTHPDQAARHALVLYSCVGNQVTVTTGPAAGAVGAVLGQRGEQGRVIAVFRPGDLARLRPGDQVSVRSCGQGHRPDWLPPAVTTFNTEPGLLESLAAIPSVTSRVAAGTRFEVAVRAVLPARLAGNGLGRPSAGWDLDLQVGPESQDGGQDLRLGDLVAITDIDARWNMGYRRGWVSVGVVGHGSSPLPGHGPGITMILSGPASDLEVREDRAGHTGVTAALLQLQ
jgi:Domain of unknown function (DUF4438), N-terminal/Domain of unknown function (DUF4438), C-terminal